MMTLRQILHVLFIDRGLTSLRTAGMHSAAVSGEAEVLNPKGMTRQESTHILKLGDGKDIC